MKTYDQQQIEESVCDRSAQLWTVALNRRKKDTVAFPVRNSASVNQKHVQLLNQKIQNQVANSKHKDLQISILKQQIAALAQQTTLSRVQPQPKNHFKPKMTEEKQKKRNKTKQNHSVTEICEQDTPLQQISKEKILALLGSTSEYHSFVEYYRNYELDYLCHYAQTNPRIKYGEKSKVPPSDGQIIQQMRKLNEKEGLGLKKYHQQLILAHMQDYYTRTTDKKIKTAKQIYQTKIRKQKQKAQQDVLQSLRKCKEAQLTRQLVRSKKKTYKN